ncbi:unnamed protein product [Sphagnum balticum]
MVPNEDLQQDYSFDVDVNCLTDCSYSIVAYVDRYYKMHLEVRVLATLDNPEEVNGALAIYGNVGDSPKPPTATSFSFVGRPIWNDGLGLFISQENVKFKQNIKFMLEGKQDMLILLECYVVNGNKRSISIEHEIYDEVRKGKTNLYTLDLTDLTSDELSGEIYVTLGKKLRDEMGYRDRAVIAISGDYDSTYMLQVNIDRRGFTMLSNDVAEVSTVMGNDVDNYIYVMTADDSANKSDNLRNFSLGAEVYTEEIEYGVRICNQSNGWDVCMLKTVDDVLAVAKSFDDIKGSTHENNAIKYFTFSYDISKCKSLRGGSYSCSFHVVCFNPNKSTNPTTYMIDFAELGVESILQEGVPRKDRVQ